MTRTFYYPTRMAEQPPWHINYANQLTELGVGMGLALADVTASVNDARYLAYAIGEWLRALREFAPGGTSQVEMLKFGFSTDPFTFPTFNPPTLPVGLTAVLAGALARIFKYVKVIKGAPGYTEGLGLIIGIVGSESPPPPPPGEVPPPTLTLAAISGTTHQFVRAKYVKNGHEYVVMECKRGTGGWEELGMSNKSPYIDTRPLLVPGQAEIREYRARYFDKSLPSSDWSGVEKVTVSP